MNPGDRVRVKSNPGRVGTMRGATDGQPPRLRVLVDWKDGTESFVLKASLELVSDTPIGPIARIRAGVYGRVKDLRGAITFYRLSGKLANLIYSLNTTNTQFYAYQFKPVLQFLESPCNGILIADEVGLGKTIEAGLIWTELRAREDAKRLLIICPAMLQKKWKDELANRFGVRAEIVDANGLHEKLQAIKENPHESIALIASIQGLRPPRGWDTEEQKSKSGSAKLAHFLDNAELDQALIDLVVIDEAHYLRNETTQTHQLARLIRPVVQNMVMLSATPIQLRSKDLFNLLHLLDEDAFPFESSFEDTLTANAPLVLLRDRILSSAVTQEEFINSLQEANSRLPFGENQQIDFLIKKPPTSEQLSSVRGRSEIAEQLDRINPLAKVVTRTLKRDVLEHRVQRLPVTIRVEMKPIERYFYEQVTEAVRRYCSKMDLATGFMTTIPQRQMSSSISAACSRWIRQVEKQEDPTDLDETIFELYGDSEEPIKPQTLGQLLTILVDIAKEIGNPTSLAKIDSKYIELIKNLKQYWINYPGKKIVLFSFYRDTLHYLFDRLANDGIDAVVLHGGMDKQEILDRFATPQGPNILLSSEVASEGVDLQFSSLIINYDLPWNPAKIEQRIGRIDRIGQESAQILIWNFVYADTIDERVHVRLLERLDIFTQALGSMEALLGDTIRTLSHDLLSHILTPEQEMFRIDRTSLAIEQANRMQAQLEKDATQLIAHSDFIQSKIRAAHELGRYIRGEDLVAYVKDFFELEFPGTRMHASDHNPLEFLLALSAEGRVEFESYLKTQRIQGTTRLLAPTPPRLLFENRLGKPLPGVERVTQDHSLVKFVADQSRLRGNSSNYEPLTSVNLYATAVNGATPGIYVYAVSRWSFSGVRNIERLEYVIWHRETERLIDGDEAEQLVNIAGLQGTDWLGASSELDGQALAADLEECLTFLEDRFTLFQSAHERENHDRINLMVNSLKTHLDNQTIKILNRIESYRRDGNERQQRMIPAEEGRLKKIKATFGRRIEDLKVQNLIHAQENHVSSGVIQIR